MRDHLMRHGCGLVAVSGLCLAMAGMPARADSAGIADGVYDAYDCAAEESDQRVEFADGTATFYGYACRLSQPRLLEGVDGAMLLSGECDGEGGQWSQGLVVLQTRDGGVSILTSEWGDHYERCE